MSELNKQLARRSLEFWASGNGDDVNEVFAATYVNHQEPSIEGDVKDLNLVDWQALVAGHHAAFSQSRVRILMQIAEEDLVATRWEFSVLHTGEYAGHEPTGKTAVWIGMEIDRIRDGRIVESWVDWDKYRQLEMLGLL
ncbi:ester cyclase [Hoeflea prorocentri]|uniref:Ester cyclase n=1 Tax=Hoeflea prorocentri TaxID=1922333 RepID=A0A9X3UIH9_9HYPH|nr:ester cyclase [Hoeflea prorocentri]MCY6381050.1 ester cyclase [Hoeflea prorocentri]MDA5398850.1 ester cyclase [Hoeflea prorocentri]